MTDAQDRFCITCRYVSARIFGHIKRYVCTHPDFNVINHVTGELRPPPECDDLRHRENLSRGCGESGELWEAIE